MKIILLTIVMVISIAGNAQKRRVSKISNQEEILVSKTILADKITFPISQEEITIDSMSIHSTNGHHYLLANTNKHDYVYLFKLKERGNSLYLVRTSDLNGCQTSSFDIANYRIDEQGEIRGCNGLNHFINGRNKFLNL